MRRPLLGIAALLLVAAGRLMLAPAQADPAQLGPAEFSPVAWQAPANPGYTGMYAANTRLAGLSTTSLDGYLYAAVAGGSVLRMRPDGSGREVWAQTGGRVLGFEFDHEGRMIAADALRGLVAIASEPSHHVSVLADRMPDGEPIRFPDAVTIAPDGSVYFTDASRRFSPREHGGPFAASLLDFLEHQPTGRVLVYRPGRGVEVVADGLSFANGILMSQDGKSVFVAESGNYRVWRIAANARGLDLRHGRTNQAKVLLADLPGFPDNLMRGMDGRIWLGLAKPRTASADATAGHPFLRKLALRLPRFLWPVPPAYGHVLAFDEDGKVIADLQDPAGAYPDTTGVLETADRLYIQSLHADRIGWLPKARARLP